jgi:Reverse transcriptase (RNA-dependent DNA polymerase)
MLPEFQMGAGRKRSAASALQLLTDQIQTRKVAMLLSLDIAGTHDHVLYPRLLHIMKTKRCPQWIVQLISSYLTGRTTKLNLGGRTSESRATPTRIPQGSALSLILYLIFDSELVEIVLQPDEESKLCGLR